MDNNEVAYEVQSIQWDDDIIPIKVGDKLFFCNRQNEKDYSVVYGAVEEVNPDGSFVMVDTNGNKHRGNQDDERFVRNMGAAKEYLGLYK